MILRFNAMIFVEGIAVNIKTQRLVLIIEIIVFVCLAWLSGYFEGFGGALLCGVSVLCALMILFFHRIAPVKPETEKNLLDAFGALYFLWCLHAVVSIIADRFAFNENYISIPLLIIGFILFRKQIFGVFKMFSSTSGNKS